MTSNSSDLPKRRRRKRHIPSSHLASPPGTAPGELHSDPTQLPSRVSVLAYGPEGYEEQTIEKIADIVPLMEKWPHVWVQVEGLKNIEIVEQIGTQFSLHRLVLEDVLNTQHRPKVDDYDQYLFVIVKMGQLTEHFETDQFSLILGEKIVVSFLEKPSVTFDLVRDRIRKGVGRIRNYGVDYLMYSLLDAIVDSYYPVLETLNHRLELMEAEILNNSSEETISRIHHVKGDLLYMHRAIYPMRDIMNTLAHEDSPFVSTNIIHYLRDCHDQCVQVTELTEFYRDVASGLMNTYLAYSGHKMNEIMKVLTMISAVFIPLSFVASVYGMNFNTGSSYNMPELNWVYGYPFALSLMLLVALGMLLYFKHRGWDRK